MDTDTRKILKVFGVAVTDAEEEAERQRVHAAELASSGDRAQLVKLLQDASDLCRELNSRWLEVTQRVMAIQTQVLSQLGEAAARLQATLGKQK
jgi:predicted Zn-dependent protease